MSKFQKIALLIFVGTLALLIYAEVNKKVPLNWFDSYTKTDKIPLGTKVFYNLLHEKLQENLIDIDIPPFEKLSYDSIQGTYLFVNYDLSFDEYEAKKLLEWTAQGNTLFLSSNFHSSFILDTLQIKSEQAYLFNRIDTQPMLELVNKKFKTKDPYLFDQDAIVRYFKEFDTLNVTVLGISQAFNDTLSITQPRINFIKSTFGKGKIILHNQPEAFTNYFLLKENNAQYTQNALSYINDGSTVYWDNYYKTGNSYDISPLKIILVNPSLKWAYYFVLIGALFFILFEGKRKQRSIPIVPQLTNKTYEYTQTISGMYLDKKDHLDIAHKQINLFLEYIRTRLRIPTENINQRFYNTLSSMSTIAADEIKILFLKIQNIQKRNQITEEELKQLYSDIQNFKNQIDGRHNE